MIRYLVVFEKTETGYSAYASDLPGCVATGKTRSQAEKSIYEAIKFHLDGMKIDKIPVPPARAQGEILLFN